jgi:hypothetical protein
MALRKAKSAPAPNALPARAVAKTKKSGTSPIHASGQRSSEGKAAVQRTDDSVIKKKPVTGEGLETGWILFLIIFFFIECPERVFLWKEAAHNLLIQQACHDIQLCRLFGKNYKTSYIYNTKSRLMYKHLKTAA